jgi:hypothetical protein
MRFKVHAHTNNQISGVVEARDLENMIRSAFKLPPHANLHFSVQVPSIGQGPDDEPLTFTASWSNVATGPEQSVALSAAPPPAPPETQGAGGAPSE